MVERLREKNRFCTFIESIINYLVFITDFLRHEPFCLKALRFRTLRYSHLKDHCKEAIINILKNNCGNYCAYCHRKLVTDPRIEHYVSQKSNKYKALVLNNFLGVCGGKYFETDEDRKNGKGIHYCHSKRGSAKLYFNPKKENHWRRIEYNADGSIYSSNVKINNDLNTTLYLNFPLINESRIKSFNEDLDLILKDWSGANKLNSYNKAYTMSLNKQYEFYHYHAVRFKKLISYELNKI